MALDIRPNVRRLFRLAPRTRDAARRAADDELEALIASRIEHLLARGLSYADARAEALRRLGRSLDEARAQLHTSVNRRERRMRFREFIESIVQDVRYAARGLARRPAFTAVSVLTLAIGVGATTAIFSAINVLLLRPLPYARPNELMRVPLFIPADGGMAKSEMGWSYPMFTMFRDGQRAFTDVAGYTFGQFNLTSGVVDRVGGEYVSASYLRVLGLAPAIGRDFDRALDAHPGAPHEAIVSYSLWQNHFDGDPSIVGRTIEIDRQPWTVIGVGPKEFHGLSGQADLLLPVTTQDATQFSGSFFNLLVIARRAPNVTVPQAIGATTTLGARVAAAYPNPMGRLNWEVAASPLDDARLDPVVARSLLVLFGAVALVLLIACVNVANLLLGRAGARRSEMAVRAAIGAGRARLVRLLLTESLLLAVVGGAASVAIAWIGARVIGAVDPRALGRASGLESVAFNTMTLSSVALDGRALAFTFAVTLVVGLLFGLAPALAVARQSLTGALKSAKRNGGAGRRTLVVGEVALALVLLAGSGLLMRSLAKLLATDGGFDAGNILTFRIAAPPGLIASDSTPGFYAEVLERVRAIPGTQDAALAGCAPLSGGPCPQATFSRGGPRTSGPMDMSMLIGENAVSPNWHSVMHVPLKRGRMLTAADRAGAPPVVLLNEAAAKKFFVNEDPIGKRVSLGFGPTDAEVVGIVGGVRQRPDSAAPPAAYVSLAQVPLLDVLFFVRSSRDAASTAIEVRRAVHDVAPQVAVYEMLTMAQRTASATADARFRARLLAAFAVVALALAAIGIYGVVSFAVTARTREIGIRIALGAERVRVQRLIIGEGAGLVAAGAVVGMAGALAATRLLRSFLFGLTPSDPTTYVVAVGLLGLVGVLASWVPALRASRVDPIVALRAE